jgi:hypothetical protein
MWILGKGFLFLREATFKTIAVMWVIINTTTGKYFSGWNDLKTEIRTTDSKIYAAHFASWDNAAYEMRLLVGNWKALPKEEA